MWALSCDVRPGLDCRFDELSPARRGPYVCSEKPLKYRKRRTFMPDLAGTKTHENFSEELAAR